jgi:hypothetical protein
MVSVSGVWATHDWQEAAHSPGQWRRSDFQVSPAALGKRRTLPRQSSGSDLDRYGESTMYNAGSEPVTILESLARIADVIRIQHLNHSERNRKIEVLGRLLGVHESHAAPDFLQTLYALHQLLMSIIATSSITHTDVKDTLLLFSEVARAAAEEIKHPRVSGGYTIGMDFGFDMAGIRRLDHINALIKTSNEAGE